MSSFYICMMHSLPLFIYYFKNLEKSLEKFSILNISIASIHTQPTKHENRKSEERKKENVRNRNKKIHLHFTKISSEEEFCVVNK